MQHPYSIGPVPRAQVCQLATKRGSPSTVAVASAGGVETGTFPLRGPEGAAGLAVAVDRESTLADDHDLAFIEIALHDSAGAFVISETRRVTVRDERAGSLQALGSGRPDIRRRTSRPRTPRLKVA
ncbi:hypothetical protein [Leifsonia sp. Root4]|uniref:hypothetical protein n=1 Tax=Leifsonia sp. Root4 TaxID=1736525 RepID=UPI003369D5C2